MLTDEQKHRKELAKLNLQNTNCFGTALYVLGYQNNDEFTKPSDFENYIKKYFQKIDSPEEGALFVVRDSFFRDYQIIHSGIIIQKDPLKIFHRIDFNENVEEKIMPYSKNISSEFYINKS